MDGRNLVVVGASLGGVEAIKALLGALPANFSAPMLIVQHAAASSPGLLATVLGSAGPLHVELAADDAAVTPGRVYVAPPDRHLLVHDGRLRVGYGPRENGARPSIDPLFRSAAVEYRNRLVGVILSGTGADGTMGLLAVERCGGASIVQSPTSASSAEMPKSALDRVETARTVPLAEIAPLIVRLLNEKPPEAPDVPSEIALEVRLTRRILDREVPSVEESTPFGPPSTVTCPDCGGVLWEHQKGGFRCHAGHAYSIQALLNAQDRNAEEALWAALRLMEERAELLSKLRTQDDARGFTFLASSYRDRETESRHHAAALRDLLERLVPQSLETKWD